ncbi:MAG: 2-phosphosulfolactate phosphatase [Chloroflexota bacterium]|nr:2-phosphosulfolactate phosphatase [Chloroflexota bacterium]
MRDFAGFQPGYAVVAIDVIRATTTIVTALALGRRCFPTPTIDAAVEAAEQLDEPLLAGELGGNVPYGFDVDNSPADLLARTDTSRPLVLVSTSGTQLICDSGKIAAATYAACLRNYRAQADYLVGRHPRVALIGAGSRGEFREEDQLCCAWLGERLMRAGYEPEGDAQALIERWQGARVEDLLVSNSVKFLRASGRERDLEFVLSHVDDTDVVAAYYDGEIIRCR